MPRAKRQQIEAAKQKAEQINDTPPQQDESATRQRARSFRQSLRIGAKGVTLGVRDGHDWVVSFPADPGKETTDRLGQGGFQYRNRKWKIFTNAANRQIVAALIKDLQAQFGDEITVNEYPVKQVVIAFDAPPGDDFTAALSEAGWHFRSDRTWNADFNDKNQKFARNFIESLPDVTRSVAAAR